MTTQNVKTQSGNRVIIQFNGIQVGLVQSVRMNDDYAPEPASGIGDIHVTEYVPTIARHSLSVSAMVLKIGSLAAAGLISENGDAVLLGNVFDIVVQDKDTGATLKKYVQVSYASGDVEVQKHAIVVTSAQFLATDTQGLGF